MASANVQVKITVKTSRYQQWLRQQKLVVVGWARAIISQN
jgi:hypothetical protein